MGQGLLCLTCDLLCRTVTHNNKLPPVPGLEPVALPPVPSLEPVALPLVPGLEPVPVPSLEPVALPSSSQSTSAESSSVDNNDTSVMCVAVWLLFVLKLLEPLLWIWQSYSKK